MFEDNFCQPLDCSALKTAVHYIDTQSRSELNEHSKVFVELSQFLVV